MKTIITVIATLVTLGSAGVLYAYSGLYDVAASYPDGAVMTWLLSTTRDRSIEWRSAGIAVPALTDPALVQEGFEHYHAMCAGCHLAPGIGSSELRDGLNPQPPILAKVVSGTSPAKLFWIIKHGVKMTGMPGWGASHSDLAIWAMVAFLEKLPNMTPVEYRAMEVRLKPDADGPDHHD